DLSYLRRTNAADYVDAEIDLHEQNPTSALNAYNNYSYVDRVRYLLAAKSLNIIPAAEVDSELEQLKQNDGLGQLQRYLFRNQITHQHNISLSGGTDKNQVAASAKFITNRGSSLYTGDE